MAGLLPIAGARLADQNIMENETVGLLNNRLGKLQHQTRPINLRRASLDARRFRQAGLAPVPVSG